MFCQLPRSYVVLHGRSASRHSWSPLLDIGAVQLKNGRIADHFYTLLRPEAPLDDSAAKALGLSPARLLEAPEMARILPTLLTFVGKLPMMVLNREPFPAQFHHALRAAHCDQPLRFGMDMQTMAYCLHPEWTSFTLPDIAALLSLPMPLHPNAWSEAMVALNCIERLRNDPGHTKGEWQLLRDRQKEDSPRVPGWRRLKIPDLRGTKILLLGDLARLGRVQASQALLLSNAELVQLPQARGLTHVVADVSCFDEQTYDTLSVIHARQVLGDSIRLLDEEGLLYLLGYFPAPDELASGRADL